MGNGRFWRAADIRLSNPTDLEQSCALDSAAQVVSKLATHPLAIGVTVPGAMLARTLLSQGRVLFETALLTEAGRRHDPAGPPTLSYHGTMRTPSLRPRPLRTAAATLFLLAPLSAPAQSLWLFGEQHDQRDQQRQVAQAVRDLAAQQRLHAVVLEMAERGAGTAGLPRGASEAEAQVALRWNEAGWPWQNYREVVMNAVAAGVPVLGGNLSRAVLREAMREPRWDAAVPAGARARLSEAVREGHCGLLPESQLAPMVRMQLARDRSLAETLAGAARGAGRETVVLMLSGAVHASRATGVPLQLPAVAPQLAVRSIGFRAEGADDGAAPDAAAAGFDELRPARHDPSPDHCEALRRRGMPGAASAPKEDAAR